MPPIQSASPSPSLASYHLSPLSFATWLPKSERSSDSLSPESLENREAAKSLVEAWGHEGNDGQSKPSAADVNTIQHLVDDSRRLPTINISGLTGSAASTQRSGNDDQSNQSAHSDQSFFGDESTSSTEKIDQDQVEQESPVSNPKTGEMAQTQAMDSWGGLLVNLWQLPPSDQREIWQGTHDFLKDRLEKHKIKPNALTQLLQDSVDQEGSLEKFTHLVVPREASTCAQEIQDAFQAHDDKVAHDKQAAARKKSFKQGMAAAGTIATLLLLGVFVYIGCLIRQSWMRRRSFRGNGGEAATNLEGTDAEVPSIVPLDPYQEGQHNPHANGERSAGYER